MDINSEDSKRLHLCDACKTALRSVRAAVAPAPHKYVYNISHHATLENLQRSARSCLLCARIVKAGKDRLMENLHGRTVFSDSHPGMDRPREFSVECEYLYDGHDVTGTSRLMRRTTYSCIFKAVTAESDPLRIPGYRPDDSTGSDATLCLARHWLQKCIQEHASCGNNSTGQEHKWRPTRLVHLGSNSTEVRLVDGDSLASDIQYTTLSHRWGDPHGASPLQRGNLDSYKVQIPIHGCSKAIHESTEVARRLGFSYIWIDSLCIIQDSVEDWQHECVLMSRVYMFSQLNISAVSAAENSQGCFWDRDRYSALPIRLQFDDTTVEVVSSPENSQELAKGLKPSTSERSYKGLYDIHSSVTDPKFWDDNLERSPLYTRGWVLQERLLAARIINFANTQLYWECGGFQATESSPYGLDGSMTQGIGLKQRLPFGRLPPRAAESSSDESSDSADDEPTGFNAWAHAVEAYTRPYQKDAETLVENLSFPSDKLVAISAVARELQLWIKSEYLAGLWRKRLLQQLCWYVREGESNRVEDYRAPSWSWASIRGRIDFTTVKSADSDETIQLAELLHVQVELVGGDEFGQVKSGSLRIRGPLIEMEVRRQEEEDSNRAPLTVSEQYITFCNRQETFTRFKQDDESRGVQTPCMLFCLPIEIEFNAGPCLHALMLESVDSLGTYRRVGFFGHGYGHVVTKPGFNDDPTIQALGTLDWDWQRRDEPGYKPRFMQKPGNISEVLII